VADFDLARARPLGRTGLHVRPVGLGTARLGAFWQGRSVADGRRALEAALSSGVDLVDTADVYARGIAERLVGRAAGRAGVTVVTKVGMLKTPLALASAARHGDRGLTSRTRGLLPGPEAERCFTAGYVTAAAARCLRRQRTQRLDVLLLHGPTTDDLRAADFLPALQDLQSRGRLTAWGASVDTVEAGRAALALAGIGVLQVPCNAVDTSVVDELRDEAGRKGVGLMAIAALGDGTLLEAARRGRPAASPSALVASLGLAALATPGVDAVVLGMSRPQHVAEVLAALPTTGVDADLVAELRRSASGAA
jgi:aryl-alcohol dehydrogenase-like predicted oxidoreductase